MMPIFDDATRGAFQEISLKVMENTPSEMFANAIISGWLVATMVWMFPPPARQKLW
jgi:formate/nitrite transporter FocA (FNT family)